jgi:hypothetical protein
MSRVATGGRCGGAGVDVTTAGVDEAVAVAARGLEVIGALAVAVAVGG